MRVEVFIGREAGEGGAQEKAREEEARAERFLRRCMHGDTIFG